MFGRSVRNAFRATLFLVGLAGTCQAGGFDMGGLIGGVMQSALQAEQQRQYMQQQQQMLQQQQQYERRLQLLQQQNAYRQQQYTPPVQTSVPPSPQQAPTNAGPYLVIDGHTLGETMTPQNLSSDYNCRPSEQFAGSQWCRSRKVVNEVWTSTSIILTASSTVAYYSKFFEDATFQAGAVAGEIDRLSALHHQQARVLHMPGSSRDLGGVIVTWGGIALTQLDPVAESTLASGGSVTAGVLVDFLNNVRDSAKRGLPIYRIAGGPGYYWVARYDRNGKGSLRFGVADAQVYDVPKPPAPPPAPLVAAAPAPTAPVVRVASANPSVVPTPAPQAPASPAQPEQAVAVTPQAAVAAPPPDQPEIPNQGHRVALVIGNSDYREVATLANPKHDAESVAAALTSAGFDVTLVTNLTLEDMKKALREFQDKANTAEWAMVYYAGHGIEVNGKNYLIPIDAELRSDLDADDEAIPLDRVLARLNGVKKLRLVVLDACRENPFEAKMQRRDGTRGVTRGLARVEPGRDEMVFYAAKDQELAEDGSSDGHSPFARAFIARLATPKLELNHMFRLVTADVMDATHYSQQPFVYGSTGSEDYYFRVQ